MRSERNASQCPLKSFLLERAKDSLSVGTPLVWFMKIEAEQTDDDGVWYKSLVQGFLDGLQSESMRQTFQRQDLLVRTLRDLYR